MSMFTSLARHSAVFGRNSQLLCASTAVALLSTRSYGSYGRGYRGYRGYTAKKSASNYRTQVPRRGLSYGYRRTLSSYPYRAYYSRYSPSRVQRRMTAGYGYYRTQSTADFRRQTPTFLRTKQDVMRFLMDWNNVKNSKLLTSLRESYMQFGTLTRKQYAALVKSCVKKKANKLICGGSYEIDPVVRRLITVTDNEVKELPLEKQQELLTGLRKHYSEKEWLTAKQIRLAGCLLGMVDNKERRAFYEKSTA